MSGAPSSRSAPKSPAARSSDPYQRILATAFGVSLLVHVGAFVALAYSPSRPRVIEPSVIQGTLVDESDLVAPAAPPAPRAPDPTPEPEAPPEPVQKPPEPEVKPVPIPEEKPRERKPKPEKPPVKRPTPKKPPEPKPTELTTQQKIDAMAARRAARDGATGSQLASAGAPSGTGTLSGFCEVRMGVYMADMHGRVRSAWAYPGLDRRLETHVGLELNRSGEVLRDRVELRSGDTLFDDSVKRAIYRAAPFPPLPPCVKKTRTRILFEFRSWEDGP